MPFVFTFQLIGRLISSCNKYLDDLSFLFIILFLMIMPWRTCTIQLVIKH
ncbi:hypothetical protein V8E55_006020 [Tylopilus felleus]